MRRFVPSTSSCLAAVFATASGFSARRCCATSKTSDAAAENSAISWYLRTRQSQQEIERGLDRIVFSTSDVTQLLRAGARTHLGGEDLPLPDAIVFGLCDLFRAAKLEDDAARKHAKAPHQHSNHASSSALSKFFVDLVAFAPFKGQHVAQSVAKLQQLTDEALREEEAEEAKASAASSSSSAASLRAHHQFVAHDHVARQVRALLQATEPLHEKWLRQLVVVPRGTKIALDVRAALLHLKHQLDEERKQRPEGGGGDGNEDDDGARRNAEAVFACNTALECATRILKQHFSTSSTWLFVEELDWERNLSCAQAEAVLRAERVHPFASLLDVKARVAPSPNRKMFAFFHSHVPHEPIVQLQVALTKGVATSVDAILGRPLGRLCPLVADIHRAQLESGNDTPDADTAIFYSISSTQPGLSGIELGKALIGRATERCGAAIRTFSTLSPIPGFVRFAIPHSLAKAAALPEGVRARQAASVDEQYEVWAEPFARAFAFAEQPTALAPERRAAAATVLRLLEACEGAPFADLAGALQLFWVAVAIGAGGDASLHKLIFAAAQAGGGSRHTKAADAQASAFFAQRAAASGRELQPGAASWVHDQEFAEAAVTLLRPAVVDYLVSVKRRGRAYDPVAAFHLRNGACLFQVNALADCSAARGSAQSACFMVNYRYDLGEKLRERAAKYEASGAFDVLMGV